MSESRNPIVGYILQQIQTLSTSEILEIIFECAAELCMRRDVRRPQQRDAREARELEFRRNLPSISDSEEDL